MLWRPSEYMNLVSQNNNFSFNHHKTKVSIPVISHGNSGVIDKILRVFLSDISNSITHNLAQSLQMVRSRLTRKTGDLVTSVVQQFPLEINSTYVRDEVSPDISMYITSKFYEE